MKIALFVHCFFPDHVYGTEAYTLSLAKGLIAQGHAATVVSTRLQGESPQESAIERYVWEGVPVVSIDKNALPHQSIKGTYDQPEMGRFHEVVLRQLRPDVVHVCHLINHTASLLSTTERLGLPTYGTLTDFFGFCLNNRLQNAQGKLCQGPNALRSNCIACQLQMAAASQSPGRRARLAGLPGVREVVSLGLAATGTGWRAAGGFSVTDIQDRPGVLAERYGSFEALLAPSEVLKNAYDQRKFGTPIRLSRFGVDIDRSPKPTPPDPTKVRLGFIGQLAPHKGLHLLIEAMRRVASPALTLDVWGHEDRSSRYLADVHAAAESLPIRFRGGFARGDMARVLAQTDVLVLPSTWYENSPLTLLQALATHTPVVVSDVPGMTEFIIEGRSGFSFRRGDVGALGNRLKLFAEDPTLAGRMGAQTIYQRGSSEMVQDVLGLYAGVKALGPKDLLHART